MDILMMIIFFVGYGIAMRWGYKFLMGRSEWLDRDATTSKICKLILSYFIGGFVVLFKIFSWIVKFFRL